MTEALHTKWRPIEFEDVIGQSAVVKSVEHLVAKGTSQCFLFAGPSGVGKTTLARIIAGKVGTKKPDVLEFDASTNTGIDDVRNLQQMLQFPPFSGGKRTIIVDEAQGLSKQAWNALLKVTEEPPAWAYFFLCTTDPGKIPKTIKTRFSEFALKLISERDLLTLVKFVAKEEGMRLNVDVLGLIVDEAQGSARQALNNLAKVGHMDDRKEAASALASARDDSAEIVDFCRFIVKGGSWAQGIALLAKVDAAPESIRIVTCNYISAVLKGQKNDRAAMDLLRRLECFSVPYSQGEAQPQLILSLGRCLFAE